MHWHIQWIDTYSTGAQCRISYTVKRYLHSPWSSFDFTLPELPGLPRRRKHSRPILRRQLTTSKVQMLVISCCLFMTDVTPFIQMAKWRNCSLTTGRREKLLVLFSLIHLFGGEGSQNYANQTSAQTGRLFSVTVRLFHVLSHNVSFFFRCLW